MKSVLLKILLILSFLPFSQVWGADFIPAITNYTVKDYEGGHAQCRNHPSAGYAGVLPRVLA